MALTNTNIAGPFVVGDRKVVFFDADFDNSYPTGGESLTAADLGLNTVHSLFAEPAGGYSFEYDHANSKLKVFGTLTGTVTINPASLAAGAVANETVTVTGLATTDVVAVRPPVTIEAGIHVLSSDVSAANTLRVRVFNSTAGTVDPASASWTYVVQGRKEVLNATDLSAVLDVRVIAWGQ